MPSLSTVPEKVRLLLAPGEVREQSVVIDKTPGAGPVTARIDGGGSAFAVTAVRSYQSIRRAYTEEEILEMPPFPPSIRQNARLRGYLEDVEAASSDGSGQVSVGANQRLIVMVRLTGDLPDGEASARLVIAGSGIGSVTVPLYALVGDLSVELAAGPVQVRQGEATVLPAKAMSLAGPATQLRLALTDHNHWSVPLHVQPLSSGATAPFSLEVRAAPDAPLGTWPASLSVAAFDGLFLRSIPFTLTVQRGRVSIASAQTGPVTGIQGHRVSTPVRITAPGYGADIDFQPVSLPQGLSMPAQTRTASMGTTTTHLVDLDILQDSPLMTAAPFTVGWQARGMEHSGSITLTATVKAREVTFHQVITTPAGTALGGWVETTVRHDGSYSFRGHMHGSGFDPYEFRIVALIRSASGRSAVAAQKSGSVGGTIGGGDRDFDWSEQGTNPSIAGDWDDVSRGTMTVNKEYDDTGVLGALEDVAAAAVDWIVTAVVATPLTASIYVLGRELGKLTGAHFGPPGLSTGIAVKEGIVLLLGPGVTLAAAVAGAAAGASIRQRSMTQAEKDFANRVFRGSIDLDNVVLTDINRAGRKFVVPNVDGRSLMGLGDFYSSPVTKAEPAYPVAGQVFIHELTHVWQIEHAAFLTEVFWDAAKNAVCEATGSNPYTLPSPIPDWSSLNLEQQASIVDQWFSRHHSALATAEPGGLVDADALNDPSFPFISGNIWTGAT